MTNRYYGEFKGGLRHGLGTFYYADSSIYKGEWVNGQKEGFAEHILDDGSCILGVYEKDRMTRQLQIRLNEMDNLLCNQITQYEDAPEVGTAGTAADSTIIGRSLITPNLGLDASNQISESRVETAVQGTNSVLKLPAAATTTSPVNLNVSHQNLIQADITESPSKVTAAMRRNNARVQGDKTPILLVPPLQPNPYLGMVNFDDILEKHTLDERFMIAPIMIESLLRIHSTLKEIYKAFAASHMNDSRLGTVVTRKDWWHFCRQFRLCTSKATLVQIDRMIDLGKKNNYDAWYTRDNVKISVDGIRELAKSMKSPDEPQETGKLDVYRRDAKGCHY